LYACGGHRIVVKEPPAKRNLGRKVEQRVVKFFLGLVVRLRRASGLLCFEMIEDNSKESSKKVLKRVVSSFWACFYACGGPPVCLALKRFALLCS